MTCTERALLFECQGESLVGIVTVPDSESVDTGVLIVVGGPQYRAGSHRQFVHLARHLADRGIPCMRFDYRGMGDACGEQRDFSDVEQDIDAALGTFLDSVPSLRRVVLWGLCDGASAACCFAPDDARVSGLVLVNPWVRTEQSEAATVLRHYYVKRLLDREFWRRLFTGSVSLRRSLASLWGYLRSAVAPKDDAQDARSEGTLPERMAAGLDAASRSTLAVLSGDDIVAREFDRVREESADWRRLSREMTIERLPDADHTFSTAAWRQTVEQLSAEWVLDLDGTRQA